MDKLKEKQIEEFERLERIARRIVTKNKVAWGDFLVGMIAIMADISMTGYTHDTDECRLAIIDMLKHVFNRMDEYYGTEKKD